LFLWIKCLVGQEMAHPGTGALADTVLRRGADGTGARRAVGRADPASPKRSRLGFAAARGANPERRRWITGAALAPIHAG